MKKQKFEAEFYEKIAGGINRVFERFHSAPDCLVAFDAIFENISQIFENPHGAKYNLTKILKGNEFYSMEKEFPEENLRFFVEFIEYNKAPGDVVLAISIIKKDEILPSDARLFVLKEETLEKFSKCWKWC